MSDNTPKTVRTMERLRLGMAIANSLMAFPALYGILLLFSMLNGGELRVIILISLWLVYCALGFYFLFTYWAFRCLPGSRRKMIHWFGSAAYNVILFVVYTGALVLLGGVGGGIPEPTFWLLAILGLFSFVGAGGIISMAQGLFQLRLIRLQKEEAERAEIAREIAANAGTV